MTYQRQKPPPGIQLNRNHPLAQGLVACWLLNEGSGLRANDLSGNNNTGTLTNFEPFSSTQGWTGTNQGTGLLFNRTNLNYVNCGSNPILNVTNGTIESWINLTDTTAYNIIAERNADGTGMNDISLRVDITTGKLHGRIGNAATFNEIIGNTNVADGKWHQVVFVFSDSLLYIYLDSRQDQTPATRTIGAPTSGNSLFIGHWPTTTLYYSGLISHVRIWKRALNSTEVQNLYAQPFGMFNTTFNTMNRR